MKKHGATENQSASEPRGTRLAEPADWRAIDIHEGEAVDPRAFKALVRAAVDLNTALEHGKPRRAK